jgi:hypothetical protein
MSPPMRMRNHRTNVVDRIATLLSIFNPSRKV